MADPNATPSSSLLSGRGSSQYFSGDLVDLDSDEDGISIVDGMSLKGLNSNVWDSDGEDRLSAVTQDASSAQDATSTGSSDDDGIPVVEANSYSFDDVLKALPGFFETRGGRFTTRE